jgi:site-specific recombinase XerD
VNHYRQPLEHHVLRVLGHLPVAEVTVADLRRLIDQVGRKGLAPPTVAAVVKVLSGLLRYGIRLGILEHNPVRDLDREDRPSSGRVTEPRYLTPAEVGRLLGAMTDTFRPGCRRVCVRGTPYLRGAWPDPG